MGSIRGDELRAAGRVSGGEGPIGDVSDGATNGVIVETPGLTGIPSPVSVLLGILSFSPLCSTGPSLFWQGRERVSGTEGVAVGCPDLFGVAVHPLSQTC